MRVLLRLVLLTAALAGCTPYIPVKDGFGVSALVPSGDIPPEFGEFNAYDPAVTGLIANQLCATTYEPLQDRSVGAAAGGIVEARGRCQTHTPFFGP
jgi:hypothetical protein